MIASENFYTSGGTLGRSAPSYVTRRADGELLGHLLDGEFCYVLTSRQMGKSSLMVRTAATLKAQGSNVAILDLTRIGQNVSIEQWYGGLLTRLGTELNLEDELDDYWVSEHAGRQGPMQRFMSALREVVFPAIKGRLVVFIDEIDAVRSLPFSSDEFFAGIRECYNSRVNEPEFSRITFCLLGVAQPSDLISNVYITPFNIGNRIELTDFSEHEAEPLLEGLRGMTVERDGEQAVLHRILYWTSGHPYLTQKLCGAVIELEKKLSPADVDAVCEDLFLSTRSREQQDNLIFVRDRVLASKEYRASILDLYDKVHRGEKVRDDDSNTTIDPLRLSGLLLVSGGFLKVRNRIYATVFDHQWVVSNMPDAELRRQKAAYRRGVMKTIIIGVPVGLAVLTLGIFAFLQTRKMERSYYLATTASAQQAFNAGDIETGCRILEKWITDDPTREFADACRPKQEQENFFKRLGHYLDGREDLETSFAIRLLSAEAGGADDCVLQHQDSLDSKPSDCVHGGPTTAASSSCAAVTTVATTMYKVGNDQVPLVAAAGTESSVQIWNPATGESLHRLQLGSASGINLPQPVDSPLKTCPLSDDDTRNRPGIMAISFSPDGSKLAIATGTWRHPLSPGYVLVWNLAQPAGPHSVSVLGPDGASDLGPDPHRGHSFDKPVDSVSWGETLDGRLYLGASSEDGTARLWEYRGDTVSAEPPLDPKKYVFPNGDVVGALLGANAIRFSNSKDHMVAIGYGDGHLVLYDLNDLLHPDPAPLYAGVVHVSGIMSMAFLEQADRVRLVVGTRDGDMLVLDPRVLRDKKEPTDAKAFKASLVANQGVLQGLDVTYKTYKNDTAAWLLTSGSNNTVGLWTVTPDFHLQQTFAGAREGVHDAIFCPGEKLNCIISASSDDKVRVWQYPYSQDRNPYTQDGASHGQEDPHSHLMPNEVGLHFPGQVLGVVFPPDMGGKLIAAVGETLRGENEDLGTIAVWDPPSGNQLEFSNTHIQELTGDRGKPLLGFDVSPDHRFIVATSRSRNLDLLDLRTDKDHPLSPSVNVTLKAKIRVRCLDPDGKQIEQCAPNQRDYLIMGVANLVDIGAARHNPAKGLCMWHIRDTGSGFTVLPGIINPCTAEAKEYSSGPNHEFLTDARNVGIFDISEDGSQIITSHDSVEGGTTVKLWKVSDLLSEKPKATTYKFTKFAFDSQFTDMSISPPPHHGRRREYIVATTVDSRMCYWPMNPKSTKPPIITRLPSRGQALAFSPDHPNSFPESDSVLAVGLQDGRILLWDWGSNPKNWNQLMEIRKQRGGVLGLAFSPQGNALASAGNDGLVTVLQAPPNR